MGAFTPDCENRLGDHGTRKLICRDRSTFAFGTIGVSKDFYRNCQVHLPLINCLQVSQFNRILAIGCRGYRFDKIIAVDVKLLYSLECLCGSDLLSDFFRCLLEDAKRLTAVDFPQSSGRFAPIILLRCIAANLRESRGNAVVAKVEI